jgi:hypothetical protein
MGRQGRVVSGGIERRREKGEMRREEHVLIICSSLCVSSDSFRFAATLSLSPSPSSFSRHLVVLS